MSITTANAVPINFKKLGGVASAGAKAHATSRDRAGVNTTVTVAQTTTPRPQQTLDIKA